MKNKCIVIISITFFILINLLNTFSFADDYEEEHEFNNLIFDANNLEVSAQASKEPVINSKAAVVIDRKTGLVLYEKNSTEIRKMASTTKIMTALVVLENTSNLYETVVISKKAASIGGSVLGIRANDKMTVNDLLYGLMLKSGNDTAIALAEKIGGSVEGFAEMMNLKAKELNLENTHFVTPHGLDNEEHHTTALELAKLANYALENKKFKEIVNTKIYTVHINGRSMGISNGNELLGNFIGVYGVKTGFTNGANRCLVTACEREGIDVITVVLGADTKNIRTKDSMNMLNYIYKNFEKFNLQKEVENYFEEWEKENFVEIEKGTQKYARIKLGKIKYSQIIINKNKIKEIQIGINCKNLIKAPIYYGDNVGEIVVKLDNTELLKCEIIVDKSVKSKNVWDYLKEVLKNFKIYMLETLI